MSAPKKFRVAVIGGGIGGLTFAISLAKCGADVDVDIYERTACFAEVGAGVAMWSRMWDMMRTLGLEEDLRRRVSTGEGGQKFAYRKSDQMDGFQFGWSKTKLFPYHRAEFLEVLVAHAPSHYRTFFGKRFKSFTDPPSGPVLLFFEDGSTAECDLLVGADGIKSTVRARVFEQLAAAEEDSVRAEQLRQHMYPQWTGQVAYRGLVPREALAKISHDNLLLSSPVQYMGKHKYITTYPISQGQLLNCVASVHKPELYGTPYDGPWTSSVTQEEMTADFSGWEPHVTSLLSLITNPTRWVVHTVADLPTYVFGRVALLGDAAHAMTPHQGSGAAQAVEDGLVLATILAQEEAQKGTIREALQVYDDVRRPFSQKVLKLSYETGEMYCLESPRFESVTMEASATGQVPLIEMQTLSEELGDVLRWTWTTTIQGDRDAAIQRFRSRVQGTVGSQQFGVFP